MRNCNGDDDGGMAICRKAQQVGEIEDIREG